MEAQENREDYKPRIFLSGNTKYYIIQRNRKGK
jgi:hypothetical protein